MKLKFVLAGCFLLFSLNTFAQGTVDFLGYGAVETNKLCMIIDGEDEYLQIKSVYQEVKSLVSNNSDEVISYNCSVINQIGSSITSFEDICNDVAESGFSDQVDISLVPAFVLEVTDNIKNCE